MPQSNVDEENNTKMENWALKATRNTQLQLPPISHVSLIKQLIP